MAEGGNQYDVVEQEKFSMLNSELNALYCQVRKADIPLSFLKEAAKPFTDCVKKNEKHSNRNLLIKVSVIIGLMSCFTYCIIYNDPLYRSILSASRQASIKMIPLWDWRWVHDVQCLVSNPLKSVSQEPDIEHCTKCLNITGIERLNNTGESLLERISTYYLNEDIPLIVENATVLWPNRGVIDVKRLKKIYLEDDVMNLFMCCEFESNLPVKHGNHRSLLRILVEQQRSNYYAHWENCFKEAAKLFRQVYRRPEFLPSTVELSNTNWVFISSNYASAESKYIPLPIEDYFTMLIQLEGHMDVILEPITVCNGLCHPLHTRLYQGSALILTDVLYTVRYIPSGDEESITVGIGGSMD